MAVIKTTEDDGINKFVMRIVRNHIKEEASLRQLKLFDVVRADGSLSVVKSKNRMQTMVMSQILLEHRDQYLKSQKLADKYIKSYEVAVENDDIDQKTLTMIMTLISKNSIEASKHLDAMGKNVLSQTQEFAKGSSQMQKLLSDVAGARQNQAQHNDKMEIKWADIEKVTGKSKDEIMKELYGEDRDDWED